MKKTGKIENLCCAHCAAEIQEKIAKLDGVNEVNISFITQKFVLDADDTQIDAVLKQAKKIIKKVEPDCVLTF
ncbi:MAG: cation transporter [Clostridia bacterium]|nr:cation transporter [Clostridia bacterium]